MMAFDIPYVRQGERLPYIDRADMFAALAQAQSPSDSEILAVCRRIVAAQAEDEGLWAPVTATEAYLAQELRTLAAAIEGDLSVLAAIEDP